MGNEINLRPEVLVRSGFDDSAIRRACLRGELVRVAAGRYLRRWQWDALDERQRHVARAVAAVSCARTAVVVSHSSAAAFWGFPRLGPWPERVHGIQIGGAGATGGSTILRHRATLEDLDIEERHGVLVTTPARTALDLAISAPLRQAVLVLDSGLHSGLFSAEELLEQLDRRASRRGAIKARRAIEFADERAESAGESLSRVVMLESGFVIPDLQRRFARASGEKAFVDFFWEESGIVGEFDGNVKYRAAESRAGLPVEEVVIREKDRENWVRAERDVEGFVRWTWTDAFVPGRLGGILRAGGVPLARGRQG
jgi:hypothetical protein